MSLGFKHVLIETPKKEYTQCVKLINIYIGYTFLQIAFGFEHICSSHYSFNSGEKLDSDLVDSMAFKNYKFLSTIAEPQIMIMPWACLGSVLSPLSSQSSTI